MSDIKFITEAKQVYMDWIDINERVPTDVRSVLFINSDDTQYVGYYNYPDEDHVELMKLLGNVEEKPVWRCFSPDGAIDVPNVTHWKEIGPPPDRKKVLDWSL